MMNRILRRCVIGLGLACAVGMAPAAFGQAYGMFKDPLPMIQRSVLPPETEGRMAGIGYDPLTGCMYFAAVRANALHVLDKGGMEQVQTVAGLNEPNGIAVAFDIRKLALSCGDGTVHIYTIGSEQKGDDGKVKTPAGRLTEEKVVQFSGEADPIRYDVKSKRAYVGHGKYVSWVDLTDGSKSPKGVEMPAQAKGLVLSPDGSKTYVNIPSKGQVVVVDNAKWEIEATWTLKDVSGNYPLAINEDGSRLFVACRTPAKLLILDTKDGTEKHRFDIGGDDAADCWWDPRGKRVYITSGNGNGMITMVWNKQGTWQVEHNLETAPGARTSLLIPERGRLIVCAPKITYPTFVFIYLTPGENEHNDVDPNKAH